MGRPEPTVAVNTRATPREPAPRPASSSPPGLPARKTPPAVLAARVVGVAILAGLAALTIWAFPYYAAPLGRRMRDPLHEILRPSGVVGQSLGLLALGLFLFLWLYPLRKRLPPSARVGAVPTWLDVHIVAGLLVPLVAAAHAGFRFTGLIGLGYASMAVVCASGIVGRYLYVHIPRSRTGVALTLDEVANERRILLLEAARTAGVHPAELEAALAPGAAKPPTSNPLSLLARMAVEDFRGRRASRALARRLASAGAGRRRLDRATVRRVARLARREMALGQQARMLEAVQRIFRHWHTAHKPFAITALIAVLLHVTIAVVMGQTWFR